MRGYEGGVGIATFVIQGDFGRVAALGGEARQLHDHRLLGVVRQDDGHPRRAVGEAERGAAVGHRLPVGYDEVAGLKVFLGTLVGFYLHRRRSCLASGVGPPRCDGDVVVVGRPVVRSGGGQRGAGGVGGGGRHVVRLHRAAHQDCHALHTIPIAVHRGTGTGGGCRGWTMGVPSAPFGRKPASSCVQAARPSSRARATDIWMVVRFMMRVV